MKKIDIGTIYTSPFYEVAMVMCDFAGLDTTIRLNHSITAWCDDKKSGFLPHETCLGKVVNVLRGLSSAFSYMQLSILEVQNDSCNEVYSQHGYTEYDIYRYHYFVFCHGVSTIHDLFLRLIGILCDVNLNNGKKWENISADLTSKGHINIISQMNTFYDLAKGHVKMRQKASHEGLIWHRRLDNYHLTNIWSNIQKQFPNIKIERLEYSKGTYQNQELLSQSKEEFVNELNDVITKMIEQTHQLFDSLLPLLINKLDESFISSHYSALEKLHMPNIDKYVLANFK